MERDEAAGPSQWLQELLQDSGLEQFYSKLTHDLQLTKLSHFDFVSEDDLLQVGLSRPSARRLLAAVRKRKSFVTAIKNKIINKLIPSSSSSTSNTDGCPINPQSLHIHSSHEQQQQNSKHKSQNLEHQLLFGRHNPTGSARADYSQPTCLINSQDILIKEEIGHGVHGFVKKGEWTTPTGRVIEVALKILRKDVLAEPVASFNDFVKEIGVMHQLNHPNIIKLYGVVLSSPMMMVTELAHFGNLRDKLRKDAGQTPISQLINFGVQIAWGMEYLESRRFVHRDLAARNIFISHGRKILIGDLGLMRAIPSQENHYLMSERTKIPYPWCAPESLRSKQFSSASDVYMFGVTLWEMFTFGKEPWAGLGLNEILANICSSSVRLECPQACPLMVYQTLLQCWNTDPTARPNFSTLYQYLSTSYPLEVRATQRISHQTSNQHLLADERRKPAATSSSSSSSSSNASSSSASSNDELEQLTARPAEAKVLECLIDDRILVIEGQPEKYWWKGQNQRSFHIGWFPLSATRWLVPSKKGPQCISKPLKDSFKHRGHLGIDLFDANNSQQGHQQGKQSANNDKSFWRNSVNGHNLLPKPSKTKSKLSKLFGISGDGASSGSSHPGQLLPKAYQRFDNEQLAANGAKEAAKLLSQANLMIRSQSDELGRGLGRKSSRDRPLPPEGATSAAAAAADGPLLIDFVEDKLISNTQIQQARLFSLADKQSQQEQVSLLDMDLNLAECGHQSGSQPELLSAGGGAFQRRASETGLNNLAASSEHVYRLSWAGSWNTATDYGELAGSNNIYSGYYCPQDAVAAATDCNRYYSPVARDEEPLPAGYDPVPPIGPPILD